ncbi:hypothetical protein DCCM_2076 [Desulfocucumis palustris]|uniref:Uncharacterized protein n=1 Tax=Desulfocucumis palustris TaxID=1898651 RepID=A0A2L2X9Q6_9FIRM|nr:hypothetical protein DCCM_2076 [Desulfocucumis palustris]
MPAAMNNLLRSGTYPGTVYGCLVLRHAPGMNAADREGVF